MKGEPNIDMYNYILLNKDDLLDDAHWAALIVLQELGTCWGGPLNIRIAFYNFCNDVGWGGECGECLFIPAETKDSPKLGGLTGSGVYFEEDVDDTSCVLSFRELYHYMKIMADRYCQQRPQDTSYFNGILEKFKRKHNI